MGKKCSDSLESAWKRRTQTVHHKPETALETSSFSYRPKPMFAVDGSYNTSSWINKGFPDFGSKGSSFGSSPPSQGSSHNFGNSPVWTVGGRYSTPSSPLGMSSPVSGSCSFSSRNTPSESCLNRLASLGNANGSSNEVHEDVKRVSSWSEYVDDPSEAHHTHPTDAYRIDMSKLLIGEKFACGMYSRLYHGIYKDQEVAVKIVKQPDEDELVADKLERQFYQEVSVLSHLHHRNIVGFIGALRKPPVFFIITEYLAGGCLKSFLLKPGTPRPLSFSRLLALALDIARGMEYLHSQGVLHLDLKSMNLVLNAEGQVKVTDFGVARNQSECESMTRDCGTYRWMAPEMISNKITSTKADVYSFGIVLWELCTGGEVPFGDMTAIQAAFAVTDKGARPSISADFPREMRQIMQQCWHQEPDKRPNFWQIVKKLEDIQQGCMKRNASLCSRHGDSEKKNWFMRWLKGLIPTEAHS